MGNKKWYLSKTLWANLLMFIGVAVLEVTGSDALNAELQASILAGVNILLRLITKTGLAA